VTPTPSQIAPVLSQAASSTASSASKACFAGSESVRLESGRSKFISDVLVGDRVLVADATGKTSFSEVSRTCSSVTSSSLSCSSNSSNINMNMNSSIETVMSKCRVRSEHLWGTED
jgi:Hint module